MAIHALLGKPGAGKSYNAVQRVKEALESGRVVVTSLPLKADNPVIAKALVDGLLVKAASAHGTAAAGEVSLATWQGWKTAFAEGGEAVWHRTVTDAKTGESQHYGPLVIVDEASGTFGPMFRNSKGRAGTKDFQNLVDKLEVHRHHGVDVLLIYQDHSQIVPPIKALVERFHTFTNTSEMTGYPSWSMKTTNRGFAVGNAQALATSSGRFLAEVFELYDSHAEGSGNGQKVKLNAKGLLRSRPIWLRWWFIVLVLAAVGLPVFLFLTWGNVKKISSAPASVPGQTFGQSGGVGVPVVSPAPGVPAAVPIAGEAPGRPPIAGNPPSLDFRQGAPPAGVIMAGFGRSKIYFTDGGEVSADVLAAVGWRVVEALPCRVTLVSDGGETRSYRCAKGF